MNHANQQASSSEQPILRPHPAYARFNHRVSLSAYQSAGLRIIVTDIEDGQNYREVMAAHRELIVDVLQLKANPDADDGRFASSLKDLNDMYGHYRSPPYPLPFLARLVLFSNQSKTGWMEGTAMVEAIFDKYPRLREENDSHDYLNKLEEAMLGRHMFVRSDMASNIPNDLKGVRRWHLDFRNIAGRRTSRPRLKPDRMSGRRGGGNTPPPKKHINKLAPPVSVGSATVGQGGQIGRGLEAGLSGALASTSVEYTGTPPLPTDVVPQEGHDGREDNSMDVDLDVRGEVGGWASEHWQQWHQTNSPETFEYEECDVVLEEHDQVAKTMGYGGIPYHDQGEPLVDEYGQDAETITTFNWQEEGDCQWTTPTPESDPYPADDYALLQQDEFAVSIDDDWLMTQQDDVGSFHPPHWQRPLQISSYSCLENALVPPPPPPEPRVPPATHHSPHIPLLSFESYSTLQGALCFE